MIAYAWVGLALNIAGILLTGSALLADWGKHGHGSLIPVLARAWVWVKVKVFRRTRPVSLNAASGSIHFSGSAGGYVRSPANPNAQLFEQVASLRREVDKLHERINTERAVTEQGIAEVRASVVTARADAHEALGVVEKMVEDVATGTVRRELVGLLLIGLGSIVSAIPVLLRWT